MKDGYSKTYFFLATLNYWILGKQSRLVNLTTHTANYFIIPKIRNLDSYVKIFKDFHDAFGDFKNQTIHIFAAFNWKELKMIEILS